MPRRGFHSPALELGFAQAYAASSVKASSRLRLVQAGFMAAGLKALYWEKHNIWLLTFGTSCVILELLTYLVLITNKQFWRHDQFKSYRFVLASAGYLMQIMACERPVVNLAIFPAIGHALLIVFDQMRLQSTINVYIVNTVIFFLCQANALMRPRFHHSPALALRDTVIFALGGFLLPCLILHNLELQARRHFLARASGLQADDLGEYWARKLNLFDHRG